jgi:hypothetical protein
MHGEGKSFDAVNTGTRVHCNAYVDRDESLLPPAAAQGQSARAEAARTGDGGKRKDSRTNHSTGDQRCRSDIYRIQWP